MPTPSPSSSPLLRRVGASALAVTTALVVAAVAAPAAHADNSSTLTVLGTSDVSDSFLVQSVIKPGFERMYPNVTLNYIGNASGVAIANAEAGQGSALIVHAASLENQFVSQGYSLEPAGRAVFYGDFVLLGPASDPAGVLGTGGSVSHNIVDAFQKIAAAGAAGKATFVSRGGVPGTTVSEHSIWPLTTGITTCDVSAANGGGTTPSTTSGACPATVTPPSWYAVTGAKQGANVLAADACSSQSFPNGGCYVYTDRGTFDYLQAQQMLKNLSIVVRDNSDAGAPGGSTLLTNSFHAYAINPAKFTGNPAVQINTTAAKELLNYLTLPSTQADIGAYLANVQYGAPFLPDAAPTITASATPSQVSAGKSITISGSVRNVVPGTPPLAGQPVSLRVTPSILPGSTYTGSTTKTDANGNYRLSYTPVGAATYTVATGSITQTEVPTPKLDPPFSDILSPSTGGASAPVAVHSALQTKSVAGGRNVVAGTVNLLPADAYQVGSLQLYAARYASPVPTLRYVASVDIPRARSVANYKFYLPSGRWYVQLRYVNSGVIVSSAGVIKSVTVS